MEIHLLRDEMINDKLISFDLVEWEMVDHTRDGWVEGEEDFSP